MTVRVRRARRAAAVPAGAARLVGFVWVSAAAPHSARRRPWLPRRRPALLSTQDPRWPAARLAKPHRIPK